MKKIGVIDIGNPLRRDDGIGIVLIERLQKLKKNFPRNITFIDGGTGGMNLLHILARFDAVMVVDAVDFHGKPGESRVFTVEEIQSKKTRVIVSTHESDFLNVIRLSKELGELPEKLFLFGVQPKDVSYGSGLSNEMESAVESLLCSLQQKIQTRLL